MVFTSWWILIYEFGSCKYCIGVWTLLHYVNLDYVRDKKEKKEKEKKTKIRNEGYHLPDSMAQPTIVFDIAQSLR